MSQQAFYFDGTRCSGCKTCQFACKDAADLDASTSFRKVYEYTGGFTERDSQGCITTACFGYFVSLACNHCGSPVCVQVCPTEAMHKDAESGLVRVDAHRCIGCGYCHLSCPYGAPKVDRTKGHSVKCDGCFDRMLADQKPVCVEACPARALDFGDVREMEQKGLCANIAPLPLSSVTGPNLFINEPKDACPAQSQKGLIANLLEVR